VLALRLKVAASCRANSLCGAADNTNLFIEITDCINDVLKVVYGYKSERIHYINLYIRVRFYLQVSSIEFDCLCFHCKRIRIPCFKHFKLITRLNRFWVIASELNVIVLLGTHVDRKHKVVNLLLIKHCLH